MPRTRYTVGPELEGRAETVRLQLIARMVVPANCVVQWEFLTVERDKFGRPRTLHDPPLPVGFGIVVVENGVAQICYECCIHSCQSFCRKCRVRPGDLMTVDGQNRILRRSACIKYNHDESILGQGVQSVCSSLEMHLLETQRYRAGLGAP